jgi:hypothetical protein
MKFQNKQREWHSINLPEWISTHILFSDANQPVHRREVCNSMKQGRSSEANSCSASQEIPNIWGNPTVEYRLHMSPPLVPILIQEIHSTPYHPIILT